MTKKEYMKPVIEFDELDMNEELLANSITITTTGLDDTLSKDGEGDSWTDAMSRHSAWDDGE